MNIYEKIVEVRKKIEFLQKNTEGYQYKYVNGAAILGTVRPAMDELGLLLTTDLIDVVQERYQWEVKYNDEKTKEEKTKVIIQFVTRGRMRMTWINAEKPEEKLFQEWFASGEDEDPAKSCGKLHTYGERYYFLKFFNVPTDKEDPDAFQAKRKGKKEVPQQTQNQIQPTPYKSMKILCEELADKIFEDRDKFKTWRVENNFAETLDGQKDIDLAKLFQRLSKMEREKRGIFTK